MATKKLCIGTWRDRDGVRRTHKRGARPRRHVLAGVFRKVTYYETLNEEARMRIAARYPKRIKGGIRAI